MLSVVIRIPAAQDMGFVEKMKDIVFLWRAACYEEWRSKEETCALQREEVVCLWIEVTWMDVLSSARRTAGASGTHMTSSPTCAI